VELDGDRNEVTSRVADYKQDDGRGHVPLVGVAVDCRNACEYVVVCYVQLIVLQRSRNVDTTTRLNTSRSVYLSQIRTHLQSINQSVNLVAKTAGCQ